MTEACHHDEGEDQPDLIPSEWTDHGPSDPVADEAAWIEAVVHEGPRTPGPMLLFTRRQWAQEQEDATQQAFGISADEFRRRYRNGTLPPGKDRLVSNLLFLFPELLEAHDD